MLLFIFAAERQRGGTLFLNDKDSPEFTRPSLLRGTMYSRSLDLCLSGKKDVVIPGEFRNLQVIFRK